MRACVTEGCGPCCPGYQKKKATADISAHSKQPYESVYMCVCVCGGGGIV